MRKLMLFFLFYSMVASSMQTSINNNPLSRQIIFNPVQWMSLAGQNSIIIDPVTLPSAGWCTLEVAIKVMYLSAETGLLALCAAYGIPNNKAQISIQNWNTNIQGILQTMYAITTLEWNAIPQRYTTVSMPSGHGCCWFCRSKIICGCVCYCR